LRSADGTDLSRLSGGNNLSGVFKDVAIRHDAAAWESFALTQQQLDEFDERGYIAGIPVLSGSECDALAKEVNKLLVPNHPAKHLWYAYHPFVASGAWRISFAFHDLCWAPRIRIAAYQLLGGPVRLLHDQIFCKPPQSRGPSWFGFHQDFSYWNWTHPMAHLTCWIALDDTTEANGCLQYVPGSHRWGLLPPIPNDAAPALDAVKTILSPEQRRAVDTADKIKIRRGHACFHHPLILHGSSTNTTRLPRRAAVVNTILDGVLSNCVAQPANLGSFPFTPQDQPLGRSGHENDRLHPCLVGGNDSATSGPSLECLSALPRVSTHIPFG